MEFPYYRRTEMLSNYLLLGVLSLLTLNVHYATSRPGSSELATEDLTDLLIPVVEISTSDDDTNESDSLRDIKQGLPTLNSLKGLLSWKENDTASCGSISHIKNAIEAIHQKHEALINHVKCVIPEPPKNCSGLPSHSSKWNWTSWIPGDQKTHNFFHPCSDKPDKHIGPIATVFIAALEHLDKKQNSIYEFLNCACEKKSNCTAKPSAWHHLFNSTHWHNKINKLNPFNWHVFSISKPHKPSSGYYSGTLAHKPILAFFNHSSESGGQTGFVVAVTGGHVPAFPPGVYGGAEEGNISESGGFGGYVSASIPTYSGSIVVGNFPHGSGSGHSQQQSNSEGNHTISESSNLQSNASGTATAGKPGANSVPIPKVYVNVEATTSNTNISNDVVPNTNKQPPTQ